MTPCRHPRCSKRKSSGRRASCACPNPWIEHRSREAAKRRATGSPRLSQAGHSARYRASKARGLFDVPTGLLTGPCKTDTARLCSWARAREAGWPAGALRTADDEERGQRQLSRAVSGEFGEAVGRAAQGSVVQATIDRTVLKSSITLHKVLGRGRFGTVWSARTSAGAWLALKEVLIPGTDRRPFEQEVHMQRLFADRGCALAVRDAWVGQLGRQFTGVLLMDPIDATVDDLLTERAYNAALYGHLAREVKQLVELLADRRLVHGDLHMGNVGVKRSLSQGFPRILPIDNGRSLRMPVAGSMPPAKERDLADLDRFWVWRYAMLFCTRFIPHLKRAGFPPSDLLRRCCGTSVPGRWEPTAATRDKLRAWSGKLCQLQSNVRKTNPPGPVIGVRRRQP